MKIKLESHAHIKDKYSIRPGISRNRLEKIVESYNNMPGEDGFFSVALEYSRLPEYEIDSVFIIPGEEMKTTQGHLIALGIDEPIPSFKEPYETLERVAEQQGIMIVPHPFTSNYGLFRDKEYYDIEKFIEKAKNDLDAAFFLEKRNAWADLIDKRGMKKTGEFIGRYNSAREKEERIRELGGSDAKFGSDFATVYTLIESDNNIYTNDELLDAMKYGNLETVIVDNGNIKPADIISRYPFESAKNAVLSVNNLARNFITGEESSF